MQLRRASCTRSNMLTGFSTQTSARCSLKQDQKVALDRPKSSVPQSTSLSAQEHLLRPNLRSAARKRPSLLWQNTSCSGSACWLASTEHYDQSTQRSYCLA